jgi:hypothetical protein
MDTFKEQKELEDLYAAGNAPWLVWNGRERNLKNSPRQGMGAERVIFKDWLFYKCLLNY